MSCGPSSGSHSNGLCPVAVFQSPVCEGDGVWSAASGPICWWERAGVTDKGVPDLDLPLSLRSSAQCWIGTKFCSSLISLIGSMVSCCESPNSSLPPLICWSSKSPLGSAMLGGPKFATTTVGCPLDPDSYLLQNPKGMDIRLHKKSHLNLQRPLVCLSLEPSNPFVQRDTQGICTFYFLTQSCLLPLDCFVRNIETQTLESRQKRVDFCKLFHKGFFP